MMEPKVSIIIPTLNEEKNIKTCLERVLNQKTDFAYEVLVVDSGSSDQTVEIVRWFAKNHSVRLIEVSRESFSHGATRAYASKLAQGEFLVYLVADAFPANEYWLINLVKPALKDEKIAGTYSRQLPRENATISEKVRLKKRKAYSNQPAISELKDLMQYHKLEPIERILFCDFDDVSSLRRKDVLDKIPIPSVEWAEDLLWSKACLFAGYKIAFCPDSVVYHSHQPNVLYLFKRGWIDQKIAGKYFGAIYYPDLKEVCRAFFKDSYSFVKELENFEEPFQKKLWAGICEPFYKGAEMLGRYLASKTFLPDSYISLLELFKKAHIYPKDAKKRVFKTAFVVGERWQRVIFANPPAMISFQLTLPSQPVFKFSLGFNPKVWLKRSQPVDFMVAVQGELIFKKRIVPKKDVFTSWQDFELELKNWAGKKIWLDLITKSNEIKYGWVGWAEPRIISKAQTKTIDFKRRFLSAIEKKIEKKALRHP